MAALICVAGACSDGGPSDSTSAAPASRASVPAVTDGGTGAAHDHGPDHIPDEAVLAPEPLGRSDDGWHLTRIDTGTVLVTPTPYGTRSTPAERRRAEVFAAAVVDSITTRYASVGRARAAGYVRLDGDPMHYVSAERLEDGHHADPSAPEALMYLDLDDGRDPVLLGAMFLEPEPGHGRVIGGSVTAWQYHEYRPEPYCVVASGFPVGSPRPDGSCAEGVVADRSPEMLHVWRWNPAGRFDAAVFTPTPEEVAAHLGR